MYDYYIDSTSVYSVENRFVIYLHGQSRMCTDVVDNFFLVCTSFENMPTVRTHYHIFFIILRRKH